VRVFCARYVGLMTMVAACVGCSLEDQRELPRTDCAKAAKTHDYAKNPPHQELLYHPLATLIELGLLANCILYGTIIVLVTSTPPPEYCYASRTVGAKSETTTRWLR